MYGILKYHMGIPSRCNLTTTSPDADIELNFQSVVSGLIAISVYWKPHMRLLQQQHASHRTKGRES